MAKKLLTPEERVAKNNERLKTYNPIMAARNALRREFSRSPVVIGLMIDLATSRRVPVFKKDGTRAKVDAVEHLCALCQKWARSSKKSKVAIDHIDPVVDPEVGYVDAEVYRKRLWCNPSNLQKTCGECHRLKSNREWAARRFKEEQEIVARLESETDVATLKKGLKRFTPKKMATLPYPEDFKIRVLALKAKARKLPT